MLSMSMGSPAGMPSRMTTSARPCDSPAVRNRTMRTLIVYEETAAFRARPRENPRYSRRTDSCTTEAASRRHAAGGPLSSLLRLLDRSGDGARRARRRARRRREAESGRVGGALRDALAPAPPAAQSAHRFRRGRAGVALRGLRTARTAGRVFRGGPHRHHARHAVSRRARDPGAATDGAVPAAAGGTVAHGWGRAGTAHRRGASAAACDGGARRGARRTGTAWHDHGACGRRRRHGASHAVDGAGAAGARGRVRAGVPGGARTLADGDRVLREPPPVPVHSARNGVGTPRRRGRPAGPRGTARGTAAPVPRGGAKHGARRRRDSNRGDGED